MTQVELAQKIIDLAAKNPEVEIKICVDNEFAAEHGWTSHKITSVKLSIWIDVNDRIHTNEDLAKDEIADMLYDGTAALSGDELKAFEALVDEYFKQHVVDAICVHTSAA